MQDYEHKTQYYETDQMGIIHHSNYIRWMEEARMNYLSLIGFPMERIEGEGIVSPVVDVCCRYRKPCRINETIGIHIIVREYNGVKLVLEYKMYEKKTGELRAEGSSVHCFTDKGGRIVSLKKVWRELDEALRDSRELPAAEGQPNM